MTLKEAADELFYCEIRYRNACGLCRPKAERDALEKEWRKANEIWSNLHSEQVQRDWEITKKKNEELKKRG